MKRIVVNGAPLTWSDSGIKFYTLALLRELTSRDDEYFYEIVVPSEVEYQFNTKKSKYIVEPYKNIFPEKYSYLNRGYWEIFILLKVTRKLKADAFFSPHQARSFLKYDTPTIIVVHDTLQWHQESEKRDSGRQFLYSLYMKGVKKATKIITISKKSGKDISKILNISEDEIVVAYEGIDQTFLTPSSDEETIKTISEKNIKEPYMLYVGGFHGRKNVTAVVDLFSNYVKRYNNKELNLTIIGKPERVGPGIIDPKVLEEIVRNNELESRVQFVGKVSREELKAIYHGAALFAYLSLYEGFGLPPLEAASQSVPTIVSNKSSLPEVMGVTENVLDPNNLDEATGVMHKILTDDNYRNELVEAGHKRLRMFSWEKTVDMIIPVFDRYTSK